MIGTRRTDGAWPEGPARPSRLARTLAERRCNLVRATRRALGSKTTVANFVLLAPDTLLLPLNETLRLRALSTGAGGILEKAERARRPVGNAAWPRSICVLRSRARAAHGAEILARSAHGARDAAGAVAVSDHEPGARLAPLERPVVEGAPITAEAPPAAEAEALLARAAARALVVDGSQVGAEEASEHIGLRGIVITRAPHAPRVLLRVNELPLLAADAGDRAAGR